MNLLKKGNAGKIPEYLLILRNRLFRNPETRDSLPESVILHFSYHKCMTVYFNRVMRRLSLEYAIPWKHFNSDKSGFLNFVTGSDGVKMASVNNHSDFDFDSFPSYRGSHFIRDPRDLIVSGYKYHLWTKEKWCNTKAFPWKRVTAHSVFAEHIDSEFPSNITYQQYLKGLTPEQGDVLEMLWRLPHFKSMEEWNYQNPNIIELKYEDVLSNEKSVFEKLFEHYGFSKALSEKAGEIADRFALKNIKVAKDSHFRSGVEKQWEREFSNKTKDVFKELYPDLLVRTGYESDQSW